MFATNFSWWVPAPFPSLSAGLQPAYRKPAEAGLNHKDRDGGLLDTDLSWWHLQTNSSRSTLRAHTPDTPPANPNRFPTAAGARGRRNPPALTRAAAIACE